jgi:molecular chaperone IbpA
MATYDFAPLLRSTIGFDQLPSMLSHAIKREDDGYPSYNIEKLTDERYRIVMAVAGLSREDLEIVQEHRSLSVRGRPKYPENWTILHRGINARPFSRQFELADHVEAVDAFLGNGLLVIELKRELPEALMPRQIAIGSATIVPFDSKRSPSDLPETKAS